MNDAVNPFIFLDYDKITDILMWLPDGYILKFVVRLSSRDRNDNRKPFHSEYSYIDRRTNETQYMIRRDYKYFFSIENKDNRDANVILRPGDVYMLQFIINNNILPWFMGANRIFGINKKGKLCIMTRDFHPIDLPLDEAHWMKFYPSIITFEDGTSKEGVRVVLNDDMNFFDMTVDVFFNFAYIICDMDMTSAAMSMLNYVKIKPYKANYKDLTNVD